MSDDVDRAREVVATLAGSVASGTPLYAAAVTALAAYDEQAERIARLEAELGGPCTCGSGGHPRECRRHPMGKRLHVAEMNYEAAHLVIEELEARVERLEAVARESPPCWEYPPDACGDCALCRAHAALHPGDLFDDAPTQEADE